MPNRIDLPANTLTAALAAVATCTGTNRNDPDTFAVTHLSIFGGVGVLIESTDNVSAAQAFVSVADAGRPDGSPDFEVSFVDPAGRVAGLVKYAARGDEFVTLETGVDESGFVAKDVIDVRLGERETIRAATIGTAVVPGQIDGIFASAEPAASAVLHFGPATGARFAAFAKTLGPVAVTPSNGGRVAVVEPTTHPGFEFRAVVSVAPAVAASSDTADAAA